MKGVRSPSGADERKSLSLGVILAAGAGALLTLATFYPGFMSNDSLLQLAEARAGAYRDWYPPLMAITWRYVDMVIPGPAGMLALQVAAYWTGLALCCRRLGPVAVLLAGLWPPVFGMLGTLWKDTQQVAAFTLACGLLLEAREGRPKLLWPALAVLVYGTAMRHNAPAAAVPLLAWWTWEAWSLLPSARRKAVRWALVGFAVGGLAVPFVIPVAVRATRTHHEQVIMGYDLVGMSVALGENRLPPSVQDPPLSLQELREIYTPDAVDPIYWNQRFRTLPFLETAQDLAELRAQWWRTLWQNKQAYLAHRGAVLRSQLGLASQVFYPFHPGIDPNALGVPTETTPLARTVLKVLGALAHTPLYRTWIYLVFLVLCLGAAIQRRNVAVAALACSGLCYMALYVLMSVGASLRFNLWTLETAILCAILLWSGRRDGDPPRPPGDEGHPARP